MKIFTVIVLAAMMSPAMGQSFYKCPSPKAGAPPTIQQMPCSVTGGGEQIKVAPHTPGADESAAATARMKAYSESLNSQREAQQNSNRTSGGDSLSDHMERIKVEELAKECHSLGKRVYWLRKKEKEGAHLKRDSGMDGDSREAIEEYESKCGHWNN